VDARPAAEGRRWASERDRCAADVPQRKRRLMVDLFYVAIGTGSLVLCWYFVKLCDRL
jgi:hypothetical protein